MAKTKDSASKLNTFTYEIHQPTDSERRIMRYVEERRGQMDTSYRRELVDLAEWARDEYDTIPTERISNLDIFKTGLARAVVNHRLTMLYDNPSEAVYRAVEDSDKHKVEILTQTDKYDKDISRFPAMHQHLFRTAQIEGTAIGMVSWYEKMDGKQTIGNFCTLTEVIPLSDFYWDEAGIFLNGNSAYTCNDAGYSRVLSMTQFRREYAGDEFKNVHAVLPNAERPSDKVWDEAWMKDWEAGRFSTDGDYVHVFVYKCKQFHENGSFVDKEFHIANGQVIYEGEMREPVINGEKWLPFFKIEGIPTGGFGGIGIPALIRHPQDALDRMLTMAEAQAELSVNPILFYQTTGELLPDQIDYFPGAAYPYKGTGNGITNDLQFFQQPDITAGAQYIINKMVEFITVITGVDVQALLDTSDEKAIQTQNKREIQEKILKMSVLWNETHGWTDMATIRLAYLQKYYPSMRVQRILGRNGVLETEIGYPKIKVEDFVVKESYKGGQSIKSLEKRPGAFSSMSISPEDIRFNADVKIISSQMASGVDTVKQNKWDKMLDSMARIPNVEQVLDPVKAARNTIKFAGFKNSEVLNENFNAPEQEYHPARQEFKAILVSDTIPFEPITPEIYIPEEYLYVFRDMMKLPEYKKAPQRIKKLILERLMLHTQNFTDPLFSQKQGKAREQMETAKSEADRASGQTLKAIGGDNEQPTTLAGRTRSKAAEIGHRTQDIND